MSRDRREPAEKRPRPEEDGDVDDEDEPHQQQDLQRRRTETSTAATPGQQNIPVLCRSSPSNATSAVMASLRSAWPHRTGSHQAYSPLVSSAMVCANSGSPLKPYRPFTQMVGYMLLRLFDAPSAYECLTDLGFTRHSSSTRQVCFHNFQQEAEVEDTVQLWGMVEMLRQVMHYGCMQVWLHRHDPSQPDGACSFPHLSEETQRMLRMLLHRKDERELAPLSLCSDESNAFLDEDDDALRDTRDDFDDEELDNHFWRAYSSDALSGTPPWRVDLICLIRLLERELEAAPQRGDEEEFTLMRERLAQARQRQPPQRTLPHLSVHSFSHILDAFMEDYVPDERMIPQSNLEAHFPLWISPRFAHDAVERFLRNRWNPFPSRPREPEMELAPSDSLGFSADSAFDNLYEFLEDRRHTDALLPPIIANKAFRLEDTIFGTKLMSLAPSQRRFIANMWRRIIDLLCRAGEDHKRWPWFPVATVNGIKYSVVDAIIECLRCDPSDNDDLWELLTSILLECETLPLLHFPAYLIDADLSIEGACDTSAFVNAEQEFDEFLRHTYSQRRGPNSDVSLYRSGRASGFHEKQLRRILLHDTAAKALEVNSSKSEGFGRACFEPEVFTFLLNCAQEEEEKKSPVHQEAEEGEKRTILLEVHAFGRRFTMFELLLEALHLCRRRDSLRSLILSELLCVNISTAPLAPTGDNNKKKTTTERHLLRRSLRLLLLRYTSNDVPSAQSSASEPAAKAIAEGGGSATAWAMLGFALWFGRAPNGEYEEHTIEMMPDGTRWSAEAAFVKAAELGDETAYAVLACGGQHGFLDRHADRRIVVSGEALDKAQLEVRSGRFHSVTVRVQPMNTA